MLGLPLWGVVRCLSPPASCASAWPGLRTEMPTGGQELGVSLPHLLKKYVIIFFNFGSAGSQLLHVLFPSYSAQDSIL